MLLRHLTTLLQRTAGGRAADKRADAGLNDPEERVYYSQFGEDVIIDYYFTLKGVINPTYLDVGAYQPVWLSNTYKFYRRGSRGVLVEPSAEQAERLRKERPGDTVLECAIRTMDMPPVVDFYVMTAAALSTIVQREASHAVESKAWGEQRVEDTRSVPARTINDVLDNYFPNGVDLLDLDVEGLDFEVLQEVDFEKFHPRVVSVEVHGGHYAVKQGESYGYSVAKEAYIDFMKDKGYELLVPVLLNGIFVRS